MFSLGRIFALATVAFRYINRFFPPRRSGCLYLVTALFMVILGILIVLGKGSRVPLHKIGRKSILDSNNRGTERRMTEDNMLL